MITPDLQSAIALFKRGDKDEARRRAAAVCKATPDNADAWYVAAMMTDGEQRTRLLERALEVDPFHEKVATALGRGVAARGAAPTAPPKSTTKRQNRTLMYAAISIAALTLIGLGILAYLRFTSNCCTQLPDPLVTSWQDIATYDARRSPILTFAVETVTKAATLLAGTLTAEVQLTANAESTDGSIAATATPAPLEITATAYLYAAQTAQAELYATATSAALTQVPPAP